MSESKKKSKKSENEQDGEVFLGVGASGDPHNPSRQVSPDVHTVTPPIVPGVPVPDAEPTEPEKKDTK
jgi:hypothetical protein